MVSLSSLIATAIMVPSLETNIPIFALLDGSGLVFTWTPEIGAKESVFAQFEAWDDRGAMVASSLKRGLLSSTCDASARDLAFGPALFGMGAGETRVLWRMRGTIPASIAFPSRSDLIVRLTAQR